MDGQKVATFFEKNIPGHNEKFSQLFIDKIQDLISTIHSTEKDEMFENLKKMRKKIEQIVKNSNSFTSQFGHHVGFSLAISSKIVSKEFLPTTISEYGFLSNGFAIFLGYSGWLAGTRFHIVKKEERENKKNNRKRYY